MMLVEPVVREAEVRLGLDARKYLTDEEFIQLSHFRESQHQIECLQEFNRFIDFLKQKDADGVYKWSKEEASKSMLWNMQKSKIYYVASIILKGEHCILACKTVSMHCFILLNYKHFHFILRQISWETN